MPTITRPASIPRLFSGLAVIVAGLSLLAAGLLGSAGRAEAASFQNYRVFPGGDIVIYYTPEGAQCRDGSKGKIMIGSTEVQPSLIRKWNACRGYVWLDVPDGVPFGRIVVSMSDGKSYPIGDLQVLGEPVITKVTRQELAMSNGIVTRVTVKGSGFGSDFYQKTLYLGNKEVVSAGWRTTEILFEIDGSYPDSDLVTLRAAEGGVGYSRFVSEPTAGRQLVPTVTTVAETKVAAGSKLTVYGYGFKGVPGDLHVSIADRRLPDSVITAWTDTRIDVKTSDSLNAVGIVKVELAKKDGKGTLVARGPEVSVLTSFADDQYADEQDYLRRLHVGDAWQYTHGSSDVVVAVIDSGIDTNHPDITDNIWTNKDELPGNDVDDDKNGYVDDVHGYDFVSDTPELTPYSEHGTAVASIIGATGNNGMGIAGINWNVQLMPVVALGSDGTTTMERLGKAIRYAADNGADVINMSIGGAGWTTDYVEALTPFIAYAYEKGAVIVAAAGNGDLVDGSGRNLDMNPSSPVCNDGGKNMVIGVGSIDATGHKSFFSDYGKCIDLVAPGERAVTLGVYGSDEDSVVYGTGTSFSAPMVSGIAALMKAANPKMTNDEIRQALLSTAQPITVNVSVYGPKLGSGLVNAQAAVAKAVDSAKPAGQTSAAAPAAKVTVAPAKSTSVTPTPAKASSGSVSSKLVDRFRGSILLQVQSHGEAWYVHPTTGLRHYMKDGNAAYKMMRNFGFGITNKDIATIPQVSSAGALKSAASVCKSNAVANRLKGKILLQVQSHGEAWYVDPAKCRRVYLKNGAAAYEIMRLLGLGITNADLTKVQAGT
jgi:subtilisin family serine protease